ncbi:amidophosphoribosyltransferase, partial [bacterium]|nr:amidophosphoribosyltransferase [bacterium]
MVDKKLRRASERPSFAKATAGKRATKMCGIIGIYNHPEASTVTYLGLHALQHRGQESAGIVTAEDGKLYQHKAMGLVADVFNKKILQNLRGVSAIGHVRYSTYGESDLKNAQPFFVKYGFGSLAVCHNGNITNADELKSELEGNGAIFHTTMDTEVVMHLISHSKQQDLVDKITDALKKVIGAYNLIFLSKDKMIIVRDPNGFRPLVLGKLNQSYVVASETCSFDLIDAEFEREIKPGELVVFDKDGAHSFFPFEKVEKINQCIFEYIYFARPDSEIFGRGGVYEMRKGFGKQLAIENPLEADVVVPVPDSGVPAAIGYARQSGIPFEKGLVRSHYVGRTFIEPSDEIRNFGVKLKLNPVKDVLKDKRVILVDDSIVRGTTSKKIVNMVRRAGASEIHVRISSPPTICPCFYGIDTPTKEELIASSKNVDEICEHIGADSLKYLSQNGLYW